VGYVKGKNNVIKKQGVKISSIIHIKGNNNHIILEDDSLIIKCNIAILGDNNLVHIKKNSYVDGATFHIEDCECSIINGENTFIGASHLAVTENKSSITIGKECMLSSNINIRTGDSHSIVDLESNERINYAQNVSIGDHCWIGEGAKILKGVTLGENVIVATGAIVTSSFQNNVLIGGIPGKIIKDKVSWNKNRL